MNNVISAIRDTVPISYFNRGMAGKVFADVKKTGAKVVMRNNIPECVLLSPDEYAQLIDELEDARLEAIALERLDHLYPDRLIGQEEMLKRFGLTEADLEGYEEVELD